jgi:hypothetical protein
VLSNPHIGSVPLPEAVSRFFTGDVFMHTWDLARATGQDDTLDPEVCAAMLAGMEPIEDAMRGSGQYGARGDGPDEADRSARAVLAVADGSLFEPDGAVFVARERSDHGIPPCLPPTMRPAPRTDNYL